MPSLKLSNPFRRGVDRPSLKERAAALKATAGRVMRRKPRTSAGAVAAMAPHHPGFVPYPPAAPTHLLAIDLMIRAEGRRLLCIADAEFDRLYAEQTAGMDDDRCDAIAERLNGALRLRALDVLAADADPLPPVDWHSPPEGFMASPAIEPMSFVNIPLGLKLEAERLHGVALAEFERRRGDYSLVPFRTEPAWSAHLRRELRLDELAAAASPDRAEPAGDDRSQPGFVLYEDAGGTTHRRPVADWVGFAAQRLYSIARHELSRGFNAESGDLSLDANQALYDRLRHDLRIDALHDLAFRSREVFEANQEYAVGHRWRAFGAEAAHPDAALIALGIELDAVWEREAEADKDCDARADAATAAMPERPACLTFHESDHPFGLIRNSVHSSAMEGLAIEASDIAWMRRGPRKHDVLRDVRPGERAWHDFPGKVLEFVPWPEAQARADEILTAWDAWQGARQAVDAAHGVAEAEARCSEIAAEVNAIWDRMAGVPARTAEGLRIKLRAIRFMVRHQSLGPAPAAVLHSLLRDAGVPEADLAATAEA